MADMTARSEIEATAQSMVEKAAAEGKAFSTNPDAALFATAGNMGLGTAKTDEVRFTQGGDLYIAQGFTDGILYVKDGDWTNIHRISWPAPAMTPSASASGAGSAQTPVESAPVKSATPAPAQPEHHGGLGGILGDIASKIEDAVGGHHPEGGAGAGKVDS